LETGISSASYTAIDLTPGLTYVFTVASRNLEGYSFESEQLSVLAAQVPNTPMAPVTSINVNYVDVDIIWIAPFSQGSAIS
jgi:hypothetical protein